MNKQKLVLKLSGTSGNAFAIIGLAIKTMRRAGVAAETINKYVEEAKSGSYDHLMAITAQWFEVE